MSHKTLESNLWSWYQVGTRRFRSLGLHHTRVENGVASGTPDYEGCFRGHSWWSELKSSPRPRHKTDPVVIDWRPGQQAWLYHRSRCGGRAYLFLQVGSGAKACRYLIPGRHAPFTDGLPEQDLAVLSLVNPKAKPPEFLFASAGLHPGGGESPWVPDVDRTPLEKKKIAPKSQSR